MSKGNLFLGTASGKLGSVVLYRAFGEERARAYVAKKRNPRTWRQGLQRVFMKTAQISYSALQPLCSHTFQGCESGTPSQAAFVSRNLKLLRSNVSDEISAGRQACLECTKGNYNSYKDEICLANILMISDGSLGTIAATVSGDGSLLLPAANLRGDASYQKVCNDLGCSKGDKLHFVFAYFREEILRTISFATIVLAPSNDDMSETFIADNNINLPNPENSGYISLVGIDQAGIHIHVPHSVNAAASVREHKAGSLVQYSAEYLIPIFECSARPLGTALSSYINRREIYLDGG